MNQLNQRKGQASESNSAETSARDDEEALVSPEQEVSRGKKRTVQETVPKNPPPKKSKVALTLSTTEDNKPGGNGHLQVSKGAGQKAEATDPTVLAQDPNITFEFGQQTTKDALAFAAARRIRIIQFGGGVGSNAGDAACISLLKSSRRAVVDLTPGGNCGGG